MVMIFHGKTFFSFSIKEAEQNPFFLMIQLNKKKLRYEEAFFFIICYTLAQFFTQESLTSYLIGCEHVSTNKKKKRRVKCRRKIKKRRIFDSSLSDCNHSILLLFLFHRRLFPITSFKPDDAKKFHAFYVI